MHGGAVQLDDGRLVQLVQLHYLVGESVLSSELAHNLGLEGDPLLELSVSGDFEPSQALLSRSTVRNVQLEEFSTWVGTVASPGPGISASLSSLRISIDSSSRGISPDSRNPPGSQSLARSQYH